MISAKILQVDAGSVWLSLSLSNRVFSVFLLATLLYTLGVAITVIRRSQMLKRRKGVDRDNLFTSEIKPLRARVENLRQLQLFALYLFGFCILVQLPGVFDTISRSNVLISSNTIRQLSFLFKYDAALFLVFLLIHSLQWLLSARLAAWE